MDRRIDLDGNYSRAFEIFKAGLLGKPFPRSIERRKRVLTKLIAESDEEWQCALLKLPFLQKPRNDERYEDMLVEEARFKGGSPLSLLRCFTMAIELKVCPPRSVLNSLNIAFQKFIAGKGTVKLDQLLGLTGKHQGGRNAFGSEGNLEIQTWLTWVIFGLSEGCGLSVMEASERLCWFLERNNNKLGSYQVESLVQQYSKKWKKRYLVKYTINHPDHPRNWPSGFKSRLLQRFHVPA